MTIWSKNYRFTFTHKYLIDFINRMSDLSGNLTMELPDGSVTSDIGYYFETLYECHIANGMTQPDVEKMLGLTKVEKISDIAQRQYKRTFQKTIDGVDVYSLGSNIDNINIEDLVVTGKVTAVGAYYSVDQYPKFRTAISDDLRIDTDSAVVQLSDLIGWVDSQPMNHIDLFLMAHDGLSDDEFKKWEKTNMAIPFMKARGCSFIEHAG